MDHIAIGRRLHKLPGMYVEFSAQANLAEGQDETQFEQVPLDSPEAKTFTHYLKCNKPLSAEDELNLSYYNACTYGEETPTLRAQVMFVCDRFYNKEQP
jgi:hypothetical protein